MGACRESTPMERALNRFISQLRSVDKILWSYSGDNIEKVEYPLSKFLWIEEELEEAHRLWMVIMEEKLNERDKVVKLNNKKYPPLNDNNIVKPFMGDSKDRLDENGKKFYGSMGVIPKN
jgi:hypothetical protein